MAERRDRDYIEEIRAAIARIERHTLGLSREQFAEGKKLRGESRGGTKRPSRCDNREGLLFLAG